jgi:hypothetical protein
VIRVKVDSGQLEKILGNSVKYSNGFLQGIDLSRLEFNRILGGYTAEALGKYIDSKARMNPETLHHVYEWNQTGNNNARLFRFNVRATKTLINFDGNFLPSKSIPENSNDVFADKATVMENKISVVVEPKNSNVLVFENNGETVFTTKSVFIANPGGDAVAGSFGRVVDEFFDVYFTASIFNQLIKDLKRPDEFSKYFSQGARQGKSIGVLAGRKYLLSKGIEI